jgi:hypothetical protein
VIDADEYLYAGRAVTYDELRDEVEVRGRGCRPVRVSRDVNGRKTFLSLRSAVIALRQCKLSASAVITSSCPRS